MTKYLTFVTSDMRGIKAVFRACAHFDREQLYGPEKAFDLMLQWMHQKTKNASEPGKRFADGCGDSVTFKEEKSGTGNCTFVTPAGLFAIITTEGNTAWLVTLGRWESPATVKGYLEVLSKHCDPSTFIVNFPTGESDSLQPISLREALQRLGA